MVVVDSLGRFYVLSSCDATNGRQKLLVGSRVPCTGNRSEHPQEYYLTSGVGGILTECLPASWSAATTSLRFEGRVFCLFSRNHGDRGAFFRLSAGIFAVGKHHVYHAGEVDFVGTSNVDVGGRRGGMTFGSSFARARRLSPERLYADFCSVRG